MHVFDGDGHQIRTGAHRIDPAEGRKEATEASGFLWVDFNDPSAADLQQCADALGLHPLAVADAASSDQQPKIQRFGDQLFMVFWSLADALADDQTRVPKLFLFHGDGFLLTVRRDDPAGLLDIEQLFATEQSWLAEGSTGALFILLSTIADQYSTTVNGIEKELDILEREVFDEAVLDDASRIYRLRKRIGRSERPLSGLVNSIIQDPSQLTRAAEQNARLAAYFDDVVGDLISVGKLASDLGKSLDDVVASHESNVAKRQNEDTRKISAYGALLAVPTVIAGLYGMNFDNLPGADWELGWLVVLSAIGVLDAVIFLNFKRRNWL